MNKYLMTDDVLRFHEALVARFGGKSGVRDRGLLESAIARPQSGYYSDVIEEAAAFWESLSQNHPFLDGNKRTAVAATAVFLRINGFGYKLRVTDAEAYAWMWERYETGTMQKEHIESWIRRHTYQEQ
ncbi:MAG: type II toxin-antitoxin system death-on-curing family toxin [Silvibacterium sp.]|nr:type II toxin-antitoxin system death-on-curing family toxin [Silvibacterium sp.]